MKTEHIITNPILKTSEYALISSKRDKKNKEFLNNKMVFNWNTGEMNHIKYDKNWHDRQSYLYNTFRIDYLNKVCISSDLVPIFITLTLPSEYHPTTTKKGSVRSNPNYNSDLTVHDGYEKLQYIFRSVYKNFKIDKKFVKGLKFIRVIEPHKSFVPHLHALVYIEESKVRKFLQHVGSIIRNHSLKQTKIKVLQREKYASVYLLKYIEKTLGSDSVLNGWRIHHKINRVITMSNLNNGIDRNIFKKISRYIKFSENSELNYFEQILSKVCIEKTLFDSDKNVLRVRKYGVSESESEFKIFVEKEKYNKCVSSVDDYKEADYDYEDEFSYRILNTKIYNNKQSLIYNSDWFSLVDVDIVFEYEPPKDDDVVHFIFYDKILQVESEDLYDLSYILST